MKALDEYILIVLIVLLLERINILAQEGLIGKPQKWLVLMMFELHTKKWNSWTARLEVHQQKWINCWASIKRKCNQNVEPSLQLSASMHLIRQKWCASMGV